LESVKQFFAGHARHTEVVDDVFVSAAPITHVDGEVIAALTSLGYSVIEAQTALQQLSPEARNESVEEKVRLTLSSLARL